MCHRARSNSDKFAEENGLEKYGYVLHPRVTGFAHVFNEMKKNGILDCVQDVTIGYKGEGNCIPQTELDFVSGTLPEEMHFYIDRFSIDDVTNSSKDESKDKEVLANWVNARWKHKEAFLKRFGFKMPYWLIKN